MLNTRGEEYTSDSIHIQPVSHEHHNLKDVHIYVIYRVDPAEYGFVFVWLRPRST